MYFLFLFGKTAGESMRKAPPHSERKFEPSPSVEKKKKIKMKEGNVPELPDVVQFFCSTYSPPQS